MQGPNYLNGDWGKRPSSKGHLHCFQEIGEYGLAFKNNTHDVEYNIFYKFTMYI